MMRTPCGPLTKSLLLSAAAAFTSCLSAQTTQSASPVADNEEPLLLDVFTVDASQDTGYRAVNTVSATRINTPIQVLPVNVQVVTSEMLSDILARNSTDALRFVSGVQTGGGNDGQATLRGFSSSWNLRDGFRTYQQAVANNLDRVEVIKGPAAVLYGVTQPGGVTNTIMKSPVFGQSFIDAKILFGQYSLRRADIDVNAGSVGKDHFAVRILYHHRETHDARAFSDAREYSLMPVLAYRPWQGGLFKVEYDRTYRWGNSITTGSSTNISGYVAPAGTQGIQPLIRTLDPRIDWETNLFGPDAIFWNELRSQTYTYTQRLFQNLDLKLAYMRTDPEQLFDRPNFSYLVTPPAGAAGPLRYVWRNDIFANRTDNYLVTAVYALNRKFPLVGQVKNNFFVGYQTFLDKYHYYGLEDRVNGQPNYRYLSFSPGIYPSKAPNTQSMTYYTNPVNNRQRNAWDGFYGTWQAQWFADRLTTSLGFFNIDIENRNLNAVTQEYLSGYQGGSTLPQMGVSYEVLPKVNVFLLKAGSHFPTTQFRDAWGNAFEPQRGESLEAGLKADLFDSKLVGTVSAYAITQKNLPQLNSLAMNHVTGTLGAYELTGELKSKGIDVDLVFSPTPNWQTVLTYAYQEAYTSADVNKQNLGRRPGNHAYNMASFLSTYHFTQGAFKGFNLTASFQLFGDRVRDYQVVGGANVARLRESQPFLDLRLGYKTVLWGKKVRFDLLLPNVFNEGFPAGYQPVSSGLATQGYMHPNQQPRWMLQMGVRF